MLKPLKSPDSIEPYPSDSAFGAVEIENIVNIRIRMHSGITVIVCR
jgi:hypothetical protein